MLGVWLAVAGVAGVGLVTGVLVWRPLRRWGGQVQVERARELFLLQRERLELLFMPAAAASGKPRGLRWKDCTFESGVEFARDRKTRQLIALVPVTIQFEAIEGGEMEGVSAVANLRNATAVFYFDQGKWLTGGRAVFNMNPAEALARFDNQYEQVATHPVPGARL
jgi:hypothetical protein